MPEIVKIICMSDVTTFSLLVSLSMIRPPTKHLRKGHIYQLFDWHITQDVGSLREEHYDLLKHNNLFDIEKIHIQHRGHSPDTIDDLTLQFADIGKDKGIIKHAVLCAYYHNKNNYYIMVVNSGHGIEHHASHPNGLKNMWQCYKINNKKIMQDIFRFVALNDQQFNMNSWTSGLKKDSDGKVSDAARLWRLVDLQTIHNRVESYYDYTNLQQEATYLKSRTYRVSAEIEDITKDLKELCMHMSDNYFKILYALLGQDANTQISTKEFYDNLPNGKHYETSVKTFKKNWNHKNMNWKRRTFEYYNENLFTEPQRGGSCSWFSIMWLAFMHCLYTHGGAKAHDEYVRMMDTFMKDLEN